MSIKTNALTRGKMRQALALLQTGYLDEAKTLATKICDTNPRDAQAWYLRGTIHARQGNPREAEHCYLRAVDIDPNNAINHFALGNARHSLGDLDSAIESYRRALAIRPNFVEAHSNLGAAFQAMGRLEESVQSYKHALASDSSRAESYYNMANILHRLGRYDEAIRGYRDAVRLRPDLSVAWDNLGAVLTRSTVTSVHDKRRIGLFEEAIAVHRQALKLAPHVADTYNNVSVALRNLGRLDEASENYRHAIALDPAHTDAHEGLATLALLSGRFTEGWENYKYRASMCIPGAIHSPTKLPSDLTGKRVCIVRDQGLGDELFFLRFLARVRDRGADIAYRPDPRLATMLARTGLMNRLLEPDETVDTHFTCSAGDLPWLTGMHTLSDIPQAISIPPMIHLVNIARERLAGLGTPPYIGVTWRAGDKTKAKALYKECPVYRLANTLKMATAATVLVLQRRPEPEEIEIFQKTLGRPAHDLSALNEDLESMLALLSLIDDYVGVSNTNMHLRAAAGKTARVLVPAPPEWRWMADGNESPWFPGFRVYRQKYDGSWEDAFDMLTTDLKTAHGI